MALVFIVAFVGGGAALVWKCANGYSQPAGQTRSHTEEASPVEAKDDDKSAKAGKNSTNQQLGARPPQPENPTHRPEEERSGEKGGAESPTAPRQPAPPQSPMAGPGKQEPEPHTSSRLPTAPQSPMAGQENREPEPPTSPRLPTAPQPPIAGPGNREPEPPTSPRLPTAPQPPASLGRLSDKDLQAFNASYPSLKMTKEGAFTFADQQMTLSREAKIRFSEIAKTQYNPSWMGCMLGTCVDVNFILPQSKDEIEAYKKVQYKNNDEILSSSLDILKSLHNGSGSPDVFVLHIFARLKVALEYKMFEQKLERDNAWPNYSLSFIGGEKIWLFSQKRLYARLQDVTYLDNIAAFFHNGENVSVVYAKNLDQLYANLNFLSTADGYDDSIKAKAKALFKTRGFILMHLRFLRQNSRSIPVTEYNVELPVECFEVIWLSGAGISDFYWEDCRKPKETKNVVINRLDEEVKALKEHYNGDKVSIIEVRFLYDWDNRIEDIQSTLARCIKTVYTNTQQRYLKERIDEMHLHYLNYNYRIKFDYICDNFNDYPNIKKYVLALAESGKSERLVIYLLEVEITRFLAFYEPYHKERKLTDEQVGYYEITPFVKLEMNRLLKWAEDNNIQHGLLLGDDAEYMWPEAIPEKCKLVLKLMNAELEAAGWQ